MNNIKKWIVVKHVWRLSFFLAMLFMSCKETTQLEGVWEIAYRNDGDGATLDGSKTELINAVRKGYPIRIGWGGSRVEHFADASFLTIFEGEVFAQIHTIVGQQPLISGDSVKIRFRMQNHWTKLAGTNGYSTGFMTDYFKDSLTGGGVDRYNTTTWYVLYPNRKSFEKAVPLWNKNSYKWKDWDEN
mgnify:CR=1 FL=1